MSSNNVSLNSSILPSSFPVDKNPDSFINKWMNKHSDFLFDHVERPIEKRPDKKFVKKILLNTIISNQSIDKRRHLEKHSQKEPETLLTKRKRSKTDSYLDDNKQPKKKICTNSIKNSSIYNKQIHVTSSKNECKINERNDNYKQKYYKEDREYYSSIHDYKLYSKYDYRINAREYRNNRSYSKYYKNIKYI